MIVSRDIMTFGMGESSVDSFAPRDHVSRMENSPLATYAKPCEVRLRATAKPLTPRRRPCLSPVVEQVRAAPWGDMVYGVDVGGLPESVCLAL